MASFGYSTSPGGSGINTLIAYTFITGLPMVFAYPFLNNTGGPIWVDTATLAAPVLGTDAVTASVDIYDSQDWFLGQPLALRGSSNPAAVAIGVPSVFGFSVPILVDNGSMVWVVLRGDGNHIMVNGAHANVTEGIVSHYSPAAAPDPYPAQGAWERSQAILPIELSGSGSGTLPTTNVREALSAVEGVTVGLPNLRASIVIAEGASEGRPNVLASLMVVESIHPVAPEPHVSTDVFPALPGLAYSVHKKPNFSTRIAKSVSGREVRNAFMQYPIWDFELTYDYLPDRASGVTDLKNIVGFYLKRQGSFDTFLYLDLDDSVAVAAPIGTGDAVTTQFYWARDYGGFVEPVGQINVAQPYVLYVDAVLQTEGVDYSITMPNLIVFASAPAAAAVITADFEYYFVCRFSEDDMDFEKFMNQLWSLQSCKFESVLQ